MIHVYLLLCSSDQTPSVNTFVLTSGSSMPLIFSCTGKFYANQCFWSYTSSFFKMVLIMRIGIIIIIELCQYFLCLAMLCQSTRALHEHDYQSSQKTPATSTAFLTYFTHNSLNNWRQSWYFGSCNAQPKSGVASNKLTKKHVSHISEGKTKIMFLANTMASKDKYVGLYGGQQIHHKLVCVIHHACAAYRCAPICHISPV